jgi:hypothetical protein
MIRMKPPLPADDAVAQDHFPAPTAYPRADGGDASSAKWLILEPLDLLRVKRSGALVARQT